MRGLTTHSNFHASDMVYPLMMALKEKSSGRLMALVKAYEPFDVEVPVFTHADIQAKVRALTGGDTTAASAKKVIIKETVIPEPAPRAPVVTPVVAPKPIVQPQEAPASPPGRFKRFMTKAGSLFTCKKKRAVPKRTSDSPDSVVEDMVELEHFRKLNRSHPSM